MCVYIMKLYTDTHILSLSHTHLRFYIIPTLVNLPTLTEYLRGYLFVGVFGRVGVFGVVGNRRWAPILVGLGVTLRGFGVTLRGLTGVEVPDPCVDLL